MGKYELDHFTKAYLLFSVFYSPIPWISVRFPYHGGMEALVSSHLKSTTVPTSSKENDLNYLLGVDGGGLPGVLNPLEDHHRCNFIKENDLDYLLVGWMEGLFILKYIQGSQPTWRSPQMQLYQKRMIWITVKEVATGGNFSFLNLAKSLNSPKDNSCNFFERVWFRLPEWQQKSGVFWISS